LPAEARGSIRALRIRPSRRRSLLPCRRGQIWSWTRRIRKLLAEALRDAAGALLHEIDFVGEAANLRDARAFYKFSRRIRVPATIGIPLDRGIFMEFAEGVPLLDAPLDYYRQKKKEMSMRWYRIQFLSMKELS